MPKAKTIAALERALQAKKSQLAGLKAERRALRKQVTAVDKQIETLLGAKGPAAAAGAAPKERRGRRRGTSLIQSVVQVLAKSKAPLGVKEISARVLASGYKTKSKNVHTLIWAQIYKDDRIVRPERGKFQLKPGATV